MRSKRQAVCCYHCWMWFDTKNGDFTVKNLAGVRSCPACGSVNLLKRSYYEFVIMNGKQGRTLPELLKLEWPNGEYWGRESADG